MARLSGGRPGYPSLTEGKKGALGAIIALIGSIVAAIIVVAIVLVALEANPHNAIVKDIHDAARALVGPFDGMFTIRHHHRIEVAVNGGSRPPSGWWRRA